MSRGTRLTLAVLLLASSFGARSLAGPPPAYACSCAPTTLADFIGNPDVVIVSGTISELGLTNDGHQQGLFTASRVYQGGLPAPRLPVRGGGGGDCTVDLRGLTNIITVAQVADAGFLIPGLCAPFGDLSTPEGRQLLADADAAFGSATGPPAETDPRSVEPVALAALLAGVIGGAIALFGAIVVVARRLPRAEENKN